MAHKTHKPSLQEQEARFKERAENALASFRQMIESGNFPAQLGRAAILSASSDAPCSKWSAGNQLIMFAEGRTADARGYRQWQELGRQVKKGAKAFYIFSPRTISLTKTDDKTGEEVQKRVVIGFGLTPVFRVEDTEGAPLPAYDPPALPPLVDVAKALGVSVTYAPSAGNWGGYYRSSTEEIVLCSHAERVFFHELAHAAHYRLAENAATADSDQARKEIVAETAAAALASMYGCSGYEATSARYIAHYAGTDHDTEKTLREVMRYAAEVRDVLTLILQTEAALAEAA